MVCDSLHTQHAGKFADTAFWMGLDHDERYGTARSKHQGYLEIRSTIPGHTTTSAGYYHIVSYAGHLASRKNIVMNQIKITIVPKH